MLGPIATQSKRSETTLGFSGERLLNLMLRPGEGVSGANILGRSGLSTFADAGDDRIYALTEMGGDLYAARPGQLVKIEADGTATDVGDLPDFTTNMASNGSQIGIVAEGSYYLYDGSTVAQVEIPALPGGVTDITFMDQYFVVIGSTGTRGDGISVSGLLDGATFSALDIAFAESEPDALVAVVKQGSDLWLLGANTFEVFYNAGAGDFPFLPRGASGQQNCIGPHGVTLSNDVLFWVRTDGAVMMAQGYTPQNIATPEVQEKIAAGTVRAMTAFTDRSHDIVTVHMVDEPAWSFDLTTGLWHERNTGSGEGEWVAQCSVRWNGTDYMGTASGNICLLSDSTYQDEGETIIASATTAPIEEAGRYFPIAALYLSVRRGTNTISRASKVMLHTTRDGRNWRSHGDRTIGDKFQRIRWNGLGSFERFQARVSISDPVSRDILGASIG